MGDDSDANWQFRSEGTVVHQNEKTYWFKTLAKQGWNEIDVLAGNPGAYNRIRVLVRVVKGDIEAKLMQMH